MSNVIRLGDYITEISEKTTVNNQHMVLTSSQEGIVSQDDYFNKQVASKDNTGYKIIRRGQFTYRAMSDTGRFYINRLTDYDIGIVSPAYPVFELRTNGQILPEYLQEYFHSEHFQNAITLSSTGSTRVSLKLAKIADLRIDIPTLPKQQCAVQAISHVNHLISMQNSSAAKLDQLVKSRFVEMFDVQKYQRKTLGECTDFVDYRGHTPELSEVGTIRMINAKSVGKGFFKYIDEYVTEETYDSWMHRGFGYPGDILFVTEGHTFGNTCLIPDDLKKFALGQRVITIKGHKELLNAFLCTYMQTGMFWKDINVYRTGGTAQGIRSKDLVKIHVPIPPIELQTQFAHFVEQTEKSKLAVKQSLEKLVTLKKSLMQQYFG